MTATPDIVITDRDKERLVHVVEAWMDRPPFAEMADFLDAELARAEVVPPEAIEPTVATMNSRVEYEDATTGQRRCVTIAFPDQAGGAERVSVLSPVGAALLGLSEGQEIAWHTSDGRARRIRLLKVHFQPEAAGQYDL
ncbi:MAG TPA: nucleoside diphosphate kinase regulator [Thermodesulfobacteriota bacterium]